jgi:hypothetical protein
VITVYNGNPLAETYMISLNPDGGRPPANARGLIYFRCCENKNISVPFFTQRALCRADQQAEDQGSKTRNQPDSQFHDIPSIFAHMVTRQI